MQAEIVLHHQFVEYVPDELEEQTLYISEQFKTAVHKCCCGCGREVVTPLNPTAWRLRVDGNTVSLYPSIGSWSLPCQSHYWIRNSRVVWAPQWSKEQIARGRAGEARRRERYFQEQEQPVDVYEPSATLGEDPTPQVTPSVWQRLSKWLFG